MEGYDPYNPQSFQSGISDLASFSFALSNGSLVASIAMDRVRILALANLTTPPTVQSADGFPPQDGMQAIFYDALPWKGNPTKVFAWLGLPKNRTGKVPAVVLVHGGGGTAYTSWVKKWNEQGFAAISIAVEGQTDKRNPTNPGWQQHAWPGPQRNGIYNDSSLPLTDQWMYHAVADAVLANSLLRSLPEVDAEKIGIMGVSWGGVITSTVIGIDPRFAFAIPTYGCGHLFDADNRYGVALSKNRLYREAWDPMVRMDLVKMPVLWFSWPKDQHFPLDSQAACYRAASGPHLLTLIPNMEHSHSSAWNPPDSYAFAKSVVTDGTPWCRQTGLEVVDSVVQVVFTSTKPLDRAVLITTSDTGFTGNRNWIESPALIETRGGESIVTALLPVGTTAWFVNASGGGLTASSDYQELKD